MVWTPLAVLFWILFVHAVSVHVEGEEIPLGEGMIPVMGIIFTIAAIFCIARLFGAHA